MTTLTPWQTKVFKDQHRFKVLRCGRRAGKTVLSVVTVIYHAFKKPGDYWFVAPTYRQAKEIAWRMFTLYLPQEAILKRNETELSIELRNGSRISLKGAENPDSLRGVGLDGIVLDEYAFMSPSTWTVISPILQDRRGWAVFISTPNGYNHFYDAYNQHIKDSDYASFHYTSYDNPYLEGGEIDKERDRMSVERFGQEYLAEFTKKTGAIWTAFKRDIHLVPKRAYNPAFNHTAAIDFGFGPGHPVSVGIYEWNNQGEVCYMDGFTQEGLNIERIDQLMREKAMGIVIRNVYYETARPDLADELSKRGWPMTPAIKDVELGIAKVDEYFQVNPITLKPRLTIAEHLTTEIKQIEGYEWMEVRGEDGKFKQVPKKDDDDAPDQLRYCLYTHTQPKRAPRRSRTTGGDPITGFGARRVYDEPFMP